MIVNTTALALHPRHHLVARVADGDLGLGVDVGQARQAPLVRAGFLYGTLFYPTYDKVAVNRPRNFCCGCEK